MCPVPQSSRKAAPHQPQPHHLVCSCLSCPPCLPTANCQLQKLISSNQLRSHDRPLALIFSPTVTSPFSIHPLHNCLANTLHLTISLHVNSASKVRTPALAYPPKHHHQTNIFHPCACAFLDPTIFSPRQPSPARCQPHVHLHFFLFLLRCSEIFNLPL